MGLFSRAVFYTTVNHMKDLPLHGGKEVARAIGLQTRSRRMPAS